MAIQTITLESIVKKWRDAIKNSTAISAFCTTKYRKSLSLFVGVNGKKPPTENDCPLIIIFPGSKVEGLGESEYQYMISVGWSILQPSVTVVNGVSETTGTYETDELGQLIYAAIAEASLDYPITHIEYSIETNEFFPQFPGRIDAIITVPVAFGANLTY